MSGGLDYSSFNEFSKNIRKLYIEYRVWLEKFLLKEGARFIASVKRRTPVDTGDLRNHWQLEGIVREGDVLHCWFVNAMEYATHVEYGHAKPYKSGAAEGSSDWVDGFFMMTVSLDQIERSMPRRFDAAFELFIKSFGV